MTVLFCLATTSAFCDETNLVHRFRGMPTNEVVAFDDFQKSVDSEDLAEALGIMHWYFQVQVPDGTSALTANLHLIETNSDEVLGKLVLNTEPRDDNGNRILGIKQFRVLVIVQPLDASTEHPLFESAKLRVFAKEYLTGSSSIQIIKNPFSKNSKGGADIYNTSRLVRDLKIPSGVWDGYGTGFDLISLVADNRILRISFEKAW